MRLPKTAITISKYEYQLVRPGLELLANGLASAKLGSFPHRNAWDRVDPVLSGIYEDRAFDPAMAARIVSARSKLNKMKRVREVQLDVFELAAVALALRVSKWQPTELSKGDARVQVQALATKLERFRKRAQRLAAARLGKPGYDDAAKSWRKFVRWARYSLLQFKIPEWPSFSRKSLWRSQRVALTSMFQQALVDHFHAPLTDDQMVRMVTLAKESFRRGRQPMTLKEALSAERQGRDLLFSFVESRLELTALPGALVPPWKLATDRADRFNAYRDGLRPRVAASLS
jgi:hypothetical protein